MTINRSARRVICLIWATGAILCGILAPLLSHSFQLIATGTLILNSVVILSARDSGQTKMDELEVAMSRRWLIYGSVVASVGLLSIMFLALFHPEVAGFPLRVQQMAFATLIISSGLPFALRSWNRLDLEPDVVEGAQA
ncbi:hypothetical protein D5S17_29300 [Pseudonocardiaceae bacterium YIM PH 21723]|nr:hypothetical protein D5S17_29300 [Pseudonocardiaceae bacterium YIM PH 21723]